LVQSAGNNVARFDHDPVTLACKGLLIEESRTNLVLQSEDFLTTWQVNASSISGNVTVAPNGVTTADLLNDIATNAAHQVIQSVGSLTAGQSYTFSVFAKAATHTSFQMVFSTAAFGSGLFANFVLTGSGSIGTSSGVVSKIESYLNGWYRCSITVVSATGGTGGFVQIAANNNNSSASRLVPYLGTNTQVVNLWGGQFEAGLFPTSYIPTTTASVIRSADVCSISGSDFSGFYNPLEGSLFTSAIFNTPVTNAAAQVLVDINDTTTANRLRYLRNVANAFPRMLNTSNLLTNVDIIGSVALNPFVFNVNNSQIGTDNLGVLPVSATTLTIGAASSGVSPLVSLNGTIGSLRYYKKRLPNEKLQALTV
jgi:hypothetical protein